MSTLLLLDVEGTAKVAGIGYLLAGVQPSSRTCVNGTYVIFFP